MSAVKVRDVSPSGQGESNEDWVKGREKLYVTGTSFIKFIPHWHKWHTARDSNFESLILAVVFNTKTNFSNYVRNNLLKHGKDHEDEAVNVFTKQFCTEEQRKSATFPGLWECEERPKWGGSPDGHFVGHFIIEVKCPKTRKIEYDDNMEPIVPLNYQTQAQWYMFLSGEKLCKFIQYETDTTIHVTDIPFDKEAMWDLLPTLDARCKELDSLKSEWHALTDAVSDKEEREYLRKGRGSNNQGYQHPTERLNEVRSRTGKRYDEIEWFIDAHVPFKPKRPYTRKPKAREAELPWPEDGIEERELESLARAAKKFKTETLIKNIL